MTYNMACVLSVTLVFQDVIYKVKTAFNREFDAAYKQKEFEVARVKERNVRIREIILDLELEEVIWQPEFDDCEKPERTLVVENKEVLASCAIPSLFSQDIFPHSFLLISSCALLEVTVSGSILGHKKQKQLTLP